MVKCHDVAVSRDRAYVTPYIIPYGAGFVKRERGILHSVNEFSSIFVVFGEIGRGGFGQEVQSVGSLILFLRVIWRFLIDFTVK